jgi:hypothetical protein
MRFELREVEVMSNVFEQIVMIEDNGKEWMVPQDPANSNYQAYLASLEEKLAN